MKIVHVEARIRSFDLRMPEEINHMVTDSITDYFYTSSEVTNSNLQNEDFEPNIITFVRNTMIDTLLKNLSRLKKPACFDELILEN